MLAAWAHVTAPVCRQAGNYGAIQPAAHPRGRVPAIPNAAHPARAQHQREYARNNAQLIDVMAYEAAILFEEEDIPDEDLFRWAPAEDDMF